MLWTPIGNPQLREDGWLVPYDSDRHLTVQIKVRENRVRVWRLKAEILSGDGGECGASVQNHLVSV